MRVLLACTSCNLNFVTDALGILQVGRVINADGIRKDSDKVDRIVHWETPTNRGLISSIIAAVGYLAPVCMGIRTQCKFRQMLRLLPGTQHTSASGMSETCSEARI